MLCYVITAMLSYSVLKNNNNISNVTNFFVFLLTLLFNISYICYSYTRKWNGELSLSTFKSTTPLTFIISMYIRSKIRFFFFSFLDYLTKWKSIL